MCTPAWKIDDNDNMIINEPCCSECCEQLDICTKVGGKCVMKCEETNDVFSRKDFCEDDTDGNCKTSTSNFETLECYANGGNFMSKIDCLESSNYDYKPYCSTKYCACWI